MMTTSTIRVVLADDHRLFNDGLCALLANFPQVHVISQVYRSADIFEKIHTICPDVILLDFNMPKINGMEVARRLLSDDPTRKIVMLSMYNEARHVKEFKNLGVKGYLLKTTEVAEVVKAIEAIHAGATWFADPETKQANNHSEDYFLKTFRLTSREIDVLRQIKAGLETKEISDKLSISILTVETHRKNICTKLNLRGRNELLRFAIDHQI